MGFLADEDSAIMWRGLILNRAVQQFLEDVHWGDLDYLLIDMPPGTGDIQMGLARMLPRTEVIVVTTPPVAAQKVAARTADMARKGYLRVAGVIENMSDFICEHGTSYALFGSGGGARLAADVGVPLIGQIPLHPSVAAGGDAGTPVALEDGGPLAEAFDRIADAVITTDRPGGGHGRLQRRGCSTGSRRPSTPATGWPPPRLSADRPSPRRPGRSVRPAWVPTGLAAPVGQERPRRAGRRTPRLGQRLLVPGSPGRRISTRPSSTSDDGQHGGTSVTPAAQAITSADVAEGLDGSSGWRWSGAAAPSRRRRSGPGRRRAGPRRWRWSPRRRGGPPGPGGPR